jgi:hypothetical protein
MEKMSIHYTALEGKYFVIKQLQYNDPHPASVIKINIYCTGYDAGNSTYKGIDEISGRNYHFKLDDIIGKGVSTKSIIDERLAKEKGLLAKLGF